MISRHSFPTGQFTFKYGVFIMNERFKFRGKIMEKREKSLGKVGWNLTGEISFWEAEICLPSAGENWRK